MNGINVTVPPQPHMQSVISRDGKCYDIHGDEIVAPFINVDAAGAINWSVSFIPTPFDGNGGNKSFIPALTVKCPHCGK